MLLDLIAGARPNFVKLAPIIRAVEEAIASGQDISYRFIHTGQHTSEAMSAAMLRDLEMPAPQIELGCTGQTRGEMLASVIRNYDQILLARKPDWTIVVGDVTSTLGASLAAKFNDVQLAHVESGLRSGDRTMPEEINRIATDAIADLHFTTTRTAGEHLAGEGVPSHRIHFVGNTMVDSLLQTIGRVRPPQVFEGLGLERGRYCLLTLHRPVNVDDPANLRTWILELANVYGDLPIIFPVHPRTRKSLAAISHLPKNLYLVDPVAYAGFLYLQQEADVIITDSGGISEESSILQTPCVTLRSTTERPETVSEGTNVLAPTPLEIGAAIMMARQKTASFRARPELWDGHSSKRIVNTLLAQ